MTMNLALLFERSEFRAL